MYEFLKATEDIKQDEMPEEIQRAREVLYGHYSSLDDLWLRCDGDFLKALKHNYKAPHLVIHIHMALSLYKKWALLAPFLDESILTAEKLQRYKERAAVAIAGKEYFERK